MDELNKLNLLNHDKINSKYQTLLNYQDKILAEEENIVARESRNSYYNVENTGTHLSITFRKY
jgi:hypothetical protein